MANDDWRIRIDVEEEEHAAGLLERLTGDLDSEARELAEELKSQKLAVSRDGETIFVYAATRAAAESAHAVVEAQLRARGIEARSPRGAHWVDEEGRGGEGARARDRGALAPGRALDRRGGSLGRRAEGRDLGGGRARPRRRSVGGASRVP